METNKVEVGQPTDQEDVQAPAEGVVATPRDSPGERPIHNPHETKEFEEEAATLHEPLDKDLVGETNTESHAKPQEPHNESEASKVDSAQLEAQILEARAELNSLEQTAERFASDRSQLKTILKPENVLAPMPHLLGDVEKIFETVAWQQKWHSTQGLGYYTDLAINSMTRHLARLKDEKDQLEKLESEMRRLRTIETQYNAVKSQTARDRHTKQDAQGRVAPRRPAESDLPAEQGVTSAQQETDKPSDAPLGPLNATEAGDDYDSNTEASNFPQTVPEIYSVGWEEFEIANELHEFRSPFAIDTLEGDPEITFDEERSLWWLLNSSGTRQGTKARPGPTLQKPSMLPGQPPLPERIRINSHSITTFLSQVFSREPLMDECETGVVMVRPYRALVCFEEEIRELFSERFPSRIYSEDLSEQPKTAQSDATATEVDVNTILEEDIKPVVVEKNPFQVTEETETRGSSDQARQQDPIENQTSSDHKDMAGYEETKCLLKFMDTIKEKIEYIENPDCQDITFADLWYMFKPGDEVINEDGSQVYRIVDVTGVIHKVIPPWRTLDGANTTGAEDAYVKLHCVYITFDGHKLGPVSVHFRIPRWDGDKSVKSLPVVPLQYAVELPKKGGGKSVEDAVQALRNKFISQGRMYLDASTSAFKHMHYSGLTLERDEVDSHVVVDFNEAVLSDFIRRSELDNLMRLGQRLGGQIITEKKLSCEADCCASDDVYQDGPAEQKRSRKYLASLIPDDSTEEPPCSFQPRDTHSVRSSIDTMSESDLMIMASTAPGFVLRSRKWATLKLTHLSPPDAYELDGIDVDHQVQHGRESARVNSSTDAHVSESDTKISGPRETAFDQLVLPKGHKRVLLSLIAQHFRDKEATRKQGSGVEDQVDIVRGKGKGLIILLHGAPGVGKTSTAEGVAELFKKPLFQITCGDLGATAEDVDAALGKNFTLANKWGCVLLLDEADVFLASRSKEDFIRNGLVSVFLRVLEYYAGILFLTTNRVGDFDEAFTSRIHISLYYPQLQLEPTKDIFKLNFRLIQKRFAKKSRQISIDEKEIIDFVNDYWNDHSRERWNGRQIRNACQTALALAEFEAQGDNHEKVVDENAEVQLRVDHFTTVSEAYLDFMEYLTNVRDKDDERWAKTRQIRAMEHDIFKDGGNKSATPSPLFKKTSRERTEPSRSNSSMALSSAPAQAQQSGLMPPGYAPQPAGSESTAAPQPGAYMPYPWPYPLPPGYGPMPPNNPGFPPAAVPGAPHGPQAPPQTWPGSQHPPGAWTGYGGPVGSQPHASSGTS